MSVGMDHLRPFLPGPAAVLDDMDVSELMINGPGNVWVERLGRRASAHRCSPAHGGRPPQGRDPHRAAARAGPRGGADPRRPPGGRISRRHLCAARVASRRDHRAALRQTHLFAAAARGDRVPHARASGRRPGHAGRPGQHPGLRRDRERKDHIAQRPDRAPAGQ